MFTGLISRVGRVVGLRAAGARKCRELTVAFEPWPEPVDVGESIAVMGACLTVASIGKNGTQFSVDVLDETLRRTCLGSKRRGHRVNLERALRPLDRLGGHFVTGHVDGTGTIASMGKKGNDLVLRVTCSPVLTREMVLKGSIACDGVSLTLTRVDDAAFEVHLIPHTLGHTAFHLAREGDRVNLETDLIGKHVARLMGGREGGSPRDLLAALGGSASTPRH